ncbi:MAG: hypothetical protein AB7T49_07225 [Oligoflexales bacterium]
MKRFRKAVWTTLAGASLLVSVSAFGRDTKSFDMLEGGTVDKDGIRRIYQATGNEVALNYGSRHRNGDRYNANHTYINYEVTGYYLTANAEKIEMKTDGPNHGGCKKLPKCQWVEPRFEMDGGKANMGSEYPHPKNHNDLPCTSCVALGGDFHNKWIGYKVIAYENEQGLRVIEQWVDPDGLDKEGKPANNWVLTLKEVNEGQIMPNPKRDLPIDGEGLEAEIRIHHGKKTEMKYGKISEIVQQY